MTAQEQLPFAPRPAASDLPARDAPIPYTLTARARRVVAPESLPDLEIITPNRSDREGEGDPYDPRPPRARALRRSGRALEEIAAVLGLDLGVVAAWCRAVEVAPGPPPPPETCAPCAPAGPARCAAQAWLEGHLPDSAGLAAAGFVVGLAHTTGYALSLQTTDIEVAALALRTLRHHANVPPGRTRVVLQSGPAVGRDLAAHHWAAALQLPLAQVKVVAWPDAPDREAVRAVLRISDPDLAATVAGWRDALLQPGREPDGVSPPEGDRPFTARAGKTGRSAGVGAAAASTLTS